MKQYNALPFFEYYCWQELTPSISRQPIVQVERVQIRIDPAVFGKIEYYPGTSIANLNKKPARGYDEVVCEGSDVSAFMTLWITPQGYHAVIWDKEEK